MFLKLFASSFGAIPASRKNVSRSEKVHFRLTVILLTLFSSYLCAAPGQSENEVSVNNPIYQCRYHSEHTEFHVHLVTISADSHCKDQEKTLAESLTPILAEMNLAPDIILSDRTKCSPIYKAEDSIQGADDYSHFYEFVKTVQPEEPSAAEQLQTREEANESHGAQITWSSLSGTEKACHFAVITESTPWPINATQISSQLVPTKAHLVPLLVGVGGYIITGLTPIYDRAKSAQKKILSYIPESIGPLNTVSAIQLTAAITAAWLTQKFTAHKAKPQ